MSENPDGCLACNREEITTALKEAGVYDEFVSRATKIPTPRHKWGDVLVCRECGQAWLAAPKDATEREAAG